MFIIWLFIRNCKQSVLYFARANSKDQGKMFVRLKLQPIIAVIVDIRNLISKSELRVNTWTPRTCFTLWAMNVHMKIFYFSIHNSLHCSLFMCMSKLLYTKWYIAHKQLKDVDKIHCITMELVWSTHHYSSFSLYFLGYSFFRYCIFFLLDFLLRD